MMSEYLSSLLTFSVSKFIHYLNFPISYLFKKTIEVGRQSDLGNARHSLAYVEGI